MYIWFGFACAKDKETLLREEKPSHIVEVGDLNEFRHWLGDMFCKAYELFHQVEASIEMETSRGEDVYGKLRRDSRFADLTDFVRRQIKEMERSFPFAIGMRITCGKDYHEIVDLINEVGGIKVSNRSVRFEKAEEPGIFRQADPILSTD